MRTSIVLLLGVAWHTSFAVGNVIDVQVGEIHSTVTKPALSRQEGNKITFEDARFTVLSSHLIRIECGSGGFHDEPTLVALNRKFKEQPSFTFSANDAKLEIETDALQLEYMPGQPSDNRGLNSCLINESNFRISSKNSEDPWTYTLASTATPLPGTIRSLDLLGPVPLEDCDTFSGAQINGESLHCTPGIISRNGWVVFNDTSTPRLSSNDLGSAWWDIKERNKDQAGYQDLYFFGHGKDYRGALRDFVQLSGQIPLVPRFTLGHWWTRWYDLDAEDVETMVNEHREHALPLDLFMFDMNWHKKNNWGGYTWDSNLFPDYTDTLAKLRRWGLRVGANLHDDNGVQDYDDSYSRFARHVGVDPSSRAKIPFLSCANKTFAYGLEDLVLRPLEDAGVDVWWTDWQQGGAKGGCMGGKYNPTIWLNHIRGTRNLRTEGSDRDLILARWGGMGSHRYQVGFSGDVDQMSWSRLAYQPYFSSVGANVGFGMWSNDVAGPASDPELYVRWVQFAVLSGVFRSHDRGESAGTNCRTTFPSTLLESSCALTTPWSLPQEYFGPIREAMRSRYELTPFLYNLAREAYDTGVSIVHPMYYDYPRQEMAYATNSKGDFAQYMLGPMVVAPVVSPASEKTNFLSVKEVWVPPGRWVDRYSGWVVEGGSGGAVVSFQCVLAHTPTLVPAGSILPVNRLQGKDDVPITDLIGKAQTTSNEFRFEMHVTGDTGAGYEYRDDGSSLDYTDSRRSDAGAASWSNTTASFRWNSDRTILHVTVAIEHLVARHHMLQRDRSGYQAPNLVNLRVELLGMSSPTQVESKLAGVNAAWSQLEYDQQGGGSSWHFDGRRFGVVVDLEDLEVKFSRDTSADHGRWMVGRHTVQLSLSTLQTGQDVAAQSGARGAVSLARAAKASLDEVRLTPGSQAPVKPAALMRLCGLGRRLENLAAAGDVMGIYKGFLELTGLVEKAKSEVEAISSSDVEVQKRIAHAANLIRVAQSFTTKFSPSL